MVMIRRKGAANDRAGRHEVNGELTSDRRVLEVGDALRREQKREDVAVSGRPRLSKNKGVVGGVSDARHRARLIALQPAPPAGTWHDKSL